MVMSVVRITEEVKRKKSGMVLRTIRTARQEGVATVVVAVVVVAIAIATVIATVIKEWVQSMLIWTR